MSWLVKLYTMKATVENPRGSVEKISLKESVKGAGIVVREAIQKKASFFWTLSKSGLDPPPLSPSFWTSVR
jgi:hypothetical protein